MRIHEIKNETKEAEEAFKPCFKFAGYGIAAIIGVMAIGLTVTGGFIYFVFWAFKKIFLS